MNEILSTIFLGILSGVLTAGLLWAFASLIKAKLVPWFRQLVYDGINVKGEWSCIVYSDFNHQVIQDKDTAHSTATYILNINEQAGHLIRGTFSQDFKTDELHKHGQYISNGHIQDGILVISLVPSNKSKSTFGTLLLTVSEGGNCLKGIHSYKANNNVVSSCELELKKKN